MSIDNFPQQPMHHDDESDDDIAERLRGLYASQEVAVDRLRQLYNGEDQKAFQDFLDDVTYEALEDDEEFLANGKLMRATTSKERQREIRDRQRAIFDKAKQFVLMEADIPLEASLDDKKAAQKRIAELLRKNLDENESAEIEDVLVALGIITIDDNGDERFTYPADLFPPVTNAKWEAYNQSVIEYFRIERAVNAGTRGKEDLGVIDSSRRIAHNAVAHDLDEILGLSDLPDSTWDFEKSRKLIAKMRDMKYPTVETAELASTSKAVGESLMGLHALHALNVKVSELRK